MLRIGLISDDLTFQEIQLTLDPSECELYRSFETHSVDSILVLSSSNSIDRVLSRLMTDVDLSQPTAPLIGTIGPSSLVNAFNGRIVSASNLDGFLKLSRLAKRRKTVLEESILRQSAIAELIREDRTPTSLPHQKKRVVFLGEPSGFYLNLSRELKDQGYHVVAALTERTAYDALTSSETAGFILSLPPSLYPLELLDHIQGRSDLRSMPVILIAQEDWNVESIADYVSAFIRQTDSVSECARHLMTMFDDQSHLADALSVINHPSVRDPATGAFNGYFAKRYLPRQLEAALNKSSAFQIALINPIYAETDASLDPGDLARFYARLAAMIRSEDFLAHASWNQFVLSLPGMNEAQIRQTLDRTRRILDATLGTSNDGTMTFMYQIKSFSQPAALNRFLAGLEHQSNVA